MPVLRQPAQRERIVGRERASKDLSVSLSFLQKYAMRLYDSMKLYMKCIDAFTYGMLPEPAKGYPAKDRSVDSPIGVPEK